MEPVPNRATAMTYKPSARPAVKKLIKQGAKDIAKGYNAHTTSFDLLAKIEGDALHTSTGARASYKAVAKGRKDKYESKKYNNSKIRAANAVLDARDSNNEPY